MQEVNSDTYALNGYVMPDFYAMLNSRCGHNPTKVAVFCSRNGDKPFPIVSRDGCITIELMTGGSFEKASFSASYESYSESDYGKTFGSWYV